MPRPAIANSSFNFRLSWSLLTEIAPQVEIIFAQFRLSRKTEAEFRTIAVLSELANEL